jgi:uncharacterized protein
MSVELPDFQHILLFVAALTGAGAIAGFTAGLLAIGGGIVLVPALFFIFSALGVDEAVRMHLAVGTSLSNIIVTAFLSARSHARRGAIDMDLLKRWAPGIVAGVFAGSAIAQLVEGRTLTAIFGTVALLMAAQMAFGRESWRISNDPPSGPALQAIGAVIGAVSALVGIGGGGLGVMILTLYNVPIHRAIGTSAAAGCIVGVAGTLGFIVGGWGQPGLPPFSVGFVNLLGMLVILPASMIFAPIGARAAHALPTRQLKLIFAAFLAVMSVRMIASVLVG